LASNVAQIDTKLVWNVYPVSGLIEQVDSRRENDMLNACSAGFLLAAGLAIAAGPALVSPNNLTQC